QLARGLAARAPQREHLERQEGVRDLDVPRAIDRAHAALAQLLLDEVAADAQPEQRVARHGRGGFTCARRRSPAALFVLALFAPAVPVAPTARASAAPQHK